MRVHVCTACSGVGVSSGRQVLFGMTGRLSGGGCGQQCAPKKGPAIVGGGGSGTFLRPTCDTATFPQAFATSVCILQYCVKFDIMHIHAPKLAMLLPEDPNCENN
jgi:hypothetical protein